MGMVDDAVGKKVMSKIITDDWVASLAKEVAPQIRAEIKKAILLEVRENIDWCDIFDQKFYKKLSKIATEAIGG